MIIKDLREKRNKLMADASALLQGDVTAEKRSQFDALVADVTVIDGDISRLEAVEKHQAEQRSVELPGRPNPAESNDPAERAEVRAARQEKSFRTWMRSGVAETRDLTIAADGNVAVPISFNAQVFEAQKSYGDIYNLVSVIKTDHGEPMKLVLDDDTSNGLVNVTEGTDESEVDPTLTGKTLQLDIFSTGVIKISNGLLSDAGWNIADWIQNRLGQRFFRGVANNIYSGDSSGNVQSLSTAFTTGITTATTATLAFKDFAGAIGALDPAYQNNAVWAMSNSTLADVVGLEDSNDRPLFLPGFGDGSQGFVGTIIGKPVRLITQMPTVATGNVAVLFGDFKSGYTFRQQNPGIVIQRLVERYAAAYETGFIGFARIGGVATVPNASLPPVVAITIK